MFGSSLTLTLTITFSGSSPWKTRNYSLCFSYQVMHFLREIEPFRINFFGHLD